jgi:hypothetical protein
MKPIAKITAVSFCAALSLATLASAASSVSQCTDTSKPCFAERPGDQGPLSTVDKIVGVINQFLFYFSAVFWIAAAGFVFYAAYLYLTAAGSEERLGKAKKQLLYAVIAMAIGLMAAGLPFLINAFLSGSY